MKNLYGFIDHSGKLVIEAKYKEAQDFSEGLAFVRNDQECGYIDKTGHMAIKGKQEYWYHPFSEGLAAVDLRESLTDVKHGFIVKTGKMVIKPMDYGVSQFENGLAIISQNKKGEEGVFNGAIDKKGNIVLQPKFEMLGTTHGELLKELVGVGSKNYMYRYINRKGQLVWSPREEDYSLIKEPTNTESAAKSTTKSTGKTTNKSDDNKVYTEDSEYVAREMAWDKEWVMEELKKTPHIHSWYGYAYYDAAHKMGYVWRAEEKNDWNPTIIKIKSPKLLALKDLPLENQGYYKGGNTRHFIFVEHRYIRVVAEGNLTLEEHFKRAGCSLDDFIFVQE